MYTHNTQASHDFHAQGDSFVYPTTKEQLEFEIRQFFGYQGILRMSLKIRPAKPRQIRMILTIVFRLRQALAGILLLDGWVGCSIDSYVDGPSFAPYDNSASVEKWAIVDTGSPKPFLAAATAACVPCI